MQNPMAISINQRSLLLRVCPPQDKHDWPRARIDRLKNGVRELLPPSSLVRISFMRPNCQHSIEQQDPLLRPGFQATVIGHGAIEVYIQFLENVLQGRWSRHSVPNRKAEPMGLADVVIRILTQDHDPDFVERRQFKGREDFLPGRIDGMESGLVGKKAFQIGKIGLGNLTSENRCPGIGKSEHDAPSLTRPARIQTDCVFTVANASGSDLDSGLGRAGRKKIKKMPSTINPQATAKLMR